MVGTFRVGISRDLLRPDGTADLAVLGLDRLDGGPGIEWAFLAARDPVARPETIAGFDALILEDIRLDASSLEGVERLAVVARFGVGYDGVDVDACTERGIIVTNAPDGTRRPMATVNLALLLALSLRLRTKDRLLREGRWDEGISLLGTGLIGRTLGMVGMGSIGGETLRLTAPLGMRRLVYDPFVSDERIREVGAEPATLDEVLSTSDFVCLSVPLVPSTRGLIGAREIALMKPTAYLINATRGAVVDEPALISALEAGRIAGAGLDVFEQEPIDPANPLIGLENVILAPHSLGSTDECFTLIGQSATRSVLDVAAGTTPRYVVNRPVLEHPRTRALLEANATNQPPTHPDPIAKEH